MNKAALEYVSISMINSDEYFKVSKRNYSAALAASLKNSGMLEIPYIFKAGYGYNILTCHNRIKILKESGVRELQCYILDAADINIFIKYVALKAFRDELGPSGKLKAYFILNSFFKTGYIEKKEFCTKVLKLPLEIIENEEYFKKVLNLPENLCNYIDEKDINFKIIKDLSLLPDNWIAVIDVWVKSVQIRVNLFRMLVDNVFDIYRRGDGISAIDTIAFSDDKTLYDNIYRVRYPEFSKLKIKSESIIHEMSASGLTIDFPEYFERGFVTIKLDVDKKTDCEEQLKKIAKINTQKLKELLSFL